jgi:predicted NAD/FAD-dependent oxidoreductase
VASAVGDVDDPHVAKDVARLYDLESGDVTLVARHVVRHALPVLARPLNLEPNIDHDGLLLAGDYVQTPSIQGALVSGRRAAQVAIKRLGR